MTHAYILAHPYEAITLLPTSDATAMTLTTTPHHTQIIDRRPDIDVYSTEGHKPSEKVQVMGVDARARVV